MNTYEIYFQNETATVEEAVRWLRVQALQGLEERFSEPAPELKDRIDHELTSIVQTEGDLQRLVILWDLARYARVHQIYIGPYMGTLNGCLAAYCLGITKVNPILYGLPFEGFFPEEECDVLSGLPVPERAMEELADYLDQVYPLEQCSELLDGLFFECTLVSRYDMTLQLIEAHGGQCPDLDNFNLFGNTITKASAKVALSHVQEDGCSLGISMGHAVAATLLLDKKFLLKHASPEAYQEAYQAFPDDDPAD